MLVPRISYFPLVYDKLEKLYARALQASAEDEIWLSSGTTPLKWWVHVCRFVHAKYSLEYIHLQAQSL